MWFVLGVAVAVAGWLLMMTAIWGVLYDGDRSGYPGDANRR